MSGRQLPHWQQLRPLLRPAPFIWRPTVRRLSRAVAIDDLRAIAKRRTPRAVFDYIDGAADAELTLHRNRAVLDSVEFSPAVLRAVDEPDLGVDVFGHRSALPFALAPTGFTRMAHHTGEIAVASVGEKHDIPYALSTMGTTSIEALAAATPGARRWFQLYVWKDRGRTRDLIARAAAAGFEALIVTVDSAVTGLRRRDVHNGFAMPPALSPSTVLDAARHPHWWLNFLTTEPLQFASVTAWNGPLAELGNLLYDPSVTLADLDWVREAWSGPLVVKGVQSARDVRRLVQHGAADAVALSNHGGRQLDHTPHPLHVLREARELVGAEPSLWVDSGFTSGSDVIAAHALGADLVLIGRAYLYGLMAGGARGVERAVTILADEARRTLQLLGCRSLAELTADHVRLPADSRPRCDRPSLPDPPAGPPPDTTALPRQHVNSTSPRSTT